MPRYRFNIRNGAGFTHDEEGLELPSDGAARDHAIRGARSLMSADILEGILDLSGQIEVTDDEDREILVVPFSDAVELCSGDGTPPPDGSIEAAARGRALR